MEVNREISNELGVEMIDKFAGSVFAQMKDLKWNIAPLQSDIGLMVFQVSRNCRPTFRNIACFRLRKCVLVQN